MSKSLGNVVTLREAIDKWGRETVLLFFMTAHWRSRWTSPTRRWRRPRRRSRRFRNVLSRAGRRRGGDWDELVAALDDDFNTPDALAVLHGWRDRDLLRACARAVRARFARRARSAAPAEVVELAEQREDARAARDFPSSDQLRAEIDALGWEVRDEAGGFRLVRKQ